MPQRHLGVDGVTAGDTEDLQVRVLTVPIIGLWGDRGDGGQLWGVGGIYRGWGTSMGDGGEAMGGGGQLWGMGGSYRGWGAYIGDGGHQ